MPRITSDQAKRYALAAQGFGDPRPTGRIDARHYRKVVNRLGIIQLDSVNVFSRTHYMPFFSRLGNYDRAALDSWLWGSGEMFEYWGHEASLLLVEDHRHWRWLMNRPLKWRALTDLIANEPNYLEEVLEQVKVFGPIKTSDLKDPGAKPGEGMWNWSKGKVGLEALFLQGKVTAAGRPNFTRMYDLTERVIRPEHLGPPDLDEEEAKKQLILQGARAMGVATAEDLGDYPRLRMPQVRPLLSSLVAEGQLIEAEVDGWDRVGYLHPESTMLRRPSGTALLSPFDNLIWSRPRTERLWDFHYRIEIYVPEPKRIYGYYVLPFLLDGELVARVDLKTDRQSNRLLVKGSFGESGIDPVRVGSELKSELQTVAAWLGMNDLEIYDNGDLASYLK
ncbi:MAG TPA: crosslink repair DNA glycosylase YcaQ family protein [Acidimicrobiia bacterium]